MTTAEQAGQTKPANGAGPEQERKDLLRRALLEVKAARAKADALQLARTEPIAVVGIGCRFPGGADGPEAFWDLLVSGRNAVTEIPADRWDVDAFYDPDPDAPARTYARHGAFLDDVRGFDAALFGVTPREAASMDPQHRLLLETAWHALEHANIPPDALRATTTGVFVGIGGSDYTRMGSSDISSIDAYGAIGTSLNFAANRVSFSLGLQGPSLVVDTACSSSLVAVHLACQALRNGECDTALAGGANLVLSPDGMIALAKGRMLSPTGQCHTFDAAADGYVRGEGVGMIVLRRLSDAERGQDPILAVIRGGAVNQDGASSGITVPRGAAQEEVIRRALAAAGVKPDQVGYVEAHGTATSLGDPIEIRAMTSTLAPRTRPLTVGSVKTNIGHLEAAAGIAGVIKTVLALHHATIPPHLNLSTPNPHIPWTDDLTVPVTATPWDEPVRTAGISGFGYGGTNAHLILGSYDAKTPDPGTPDAGTSGPQTPVAVTLSAHTASALTAAAAALAAHLAAHPVPLPDLAWATTQGRAAFPHRAVITVGADGELAQALDRLAAGTPHPGLTTHHHSTTQAPHVTLLVPGRPDAATEELTAWWAARGIVADRVIEERGEPQRFAEELRKVLDDGTDILIELGPGTLAAAVRQVAGDQPVLYVPSRAAGEEPSRLTSLGLVWAHGGPVDWSAQFPRPARPPRLPGYPFEHVPYWLAARPREAGEPGEGTGTGFDPRVTHLATGHIVTQTELSPAGEPFLGEHRVYGRALVSAVVFVELMSRCAELALDGPIGFRELKLLRPLVLADDAARTVQIVMEPPTGRTAKIKVFSADPQDGWHCHLEAEAFGSDLDEPELEDESFQRARRLCNRSLDGEEFYAGRWPTQFALGPSFKLIESAMLGPGAAVGYLRAPDPECTGLVAGVRSDGLLIEACAQLVAAAAPEAAESGTGADANSRPMRVGTGAEQIIRYRDVLDGDLQCTAVLRDETGHDGGIIGDVLITNEEGEPLAELRGASFQSITPELLERMVSTGAAGRLPGAAPAGRRRRPGVPQLDPVALRRLSAERAAAKIREYLVALTASVQGCAPDEVEGDQPIMRVMDSIMVAEVKGAVDAELGMSIPLEVFFDADGLTTLSRLTADLLLDDSADAADTVDPGRTGDPAGRTEESAADGTPAPAAQGPTRLRIGRLRFMSTDEMTDLAQLDPDISAAAAPEPPGTAPSGTLLTGATGFVGAFLLAELLSRTDGNVACLVRARDEEQALSRLLDNLAGYGFDAAEHRARIVAIPGDLGRPGLGLEERTQDMLHADYGSIIHCGGLVKWTYPYQALVPANVDGTREILRLAVRGPAPRPVHFISTVGVFSSRVSPAEIIPEDLPQDVSGPLAMGYAQSKWVSERMIRTAAERGVPMSIHRINTSGHSVTGAFNRLDYLSLVLKGCIEAGIAPESADSLQLQPAPVDYVAGAVVEVAARPQLHNGTYHLLNENAMNWPEMFATVRDFGYPLEILPFDDWRDRITGVDAGTMAMLGLAPFLTDTVDHVRLPRFGTDATRNALSETGLSCPPFDRDLLHTYLRRFIASRFIAPPKGSTK